MCAQPETFLSVDAFGSNALHALMSASRDMETASMLVECGVDGFAKNDDNKSPLSMAVETLPQLAEKLLASKSRFEYRWWGKDLYWCVQNLLMPLSALTCYRPCAEVNRDPLVARAIGISFTGLASDEHDPHRRYFPNAPL
eukprot:6182502-Pleurochrysis_carterae.AAC.1